MIRVFVKIRRTNLFDVVHNALVGTEPRLSPEERLLAERDERQKQWRDHLHAFVSVNIGLFVMNIATAVLSGGFVPWAMFPLFGWGIGLGIHTLNHRAWVFDNQARLTAAEAKLGIAAPTRPMLAAPATTSDDPWPALLQACEEAVARAHTLVSEVHPAGTAALDDLEEGLATVDRLAEGAQRIQSILDSTMQGSGGGLESQIQALDRRISTIDDPALKETQLANRALLVARRAKINALKADRDRMLAKAQGFLLAVENLHLDAARLNGPEAAEGLSAPISKLTEEVQILRQVDAELKQLKG